MQHATPLSSRLLNRAELILLCLFSIALPLVEAPKNVFWFAFLVVWIARSAQMRNFGQLAPRWDALFAGVLGAALISVVCSAPYPPVWREMGDILGYTSLGWMLARTQLTRRQLLILFLCLIAASVAGIMQGGWELMTNPKRQFLQLHSVGHVNHSALYAMGIAGLAVVLASALLDNAKAAAKGLSIAAALVMLGAMVVFGSRGALIACLVAVAAFLLVHARAAGRRVWPLILAGVILLTAGLALNPTLVGKVRANFSEGGHVTAARKEAATTATEIWRHAKLTGIGAANFSAISPEQIQAWVEARGETYVARNYLYSSHAHSVYFNTLAERGLIGVLVLLAFGVAWFIELLRRLPRSAETASTAHWLCWGAGLSGFVLVFVGGIFNTSLHHEHGMLATLCLGLLLAGPAAEAEAGTEVVA